MLSRLRTFDAHGGWGRAGAVSCAHWLSWRINMKLTAAHEHVRVARALGGLPLIDAAFGRGELSYSKVRALTRAATPAIEEDFLNVALHGTADQMERLVRAYRRVGEDAGRVPGAQRPRSERRYVRRSETATGMIKLEIQLPPEEAGLVWNAMMSALDGGARGRESSAEDSGPVVGSPAVANDGPELEELRADAIVDVARGYLQHQPRTLGSAYEVVVITTQEQLEQGSEGSNGVGGFLPDGTPVPTRVAAMLACDGARVDAVMSASGELLDVGRRTRAIPAAIARALWLRDGGCRAPGCGRRRHMHAHHIEAWAAGGATKLANLVMVCSAHHRMIHEGQLSAVVRDGAVVFSNHTGLVIPSSGPSVATGRELEELEAYLLDVGLRVDAETQRVWDGTRVRVAEMIDWMLISQTGGERSVSG